MIEPGAWADLLDRLDAEEFAVRERALAELKTHGRGAAGQARAAIRTEKRLEVVRRLQPLLREWDASPERFREARAVMALAQRRDADARALLQRLAAGYPDAELTADAKAALARLKP